MWVLDSKNSLNGRYDDYNASRLTNNFDEGASSSAGEHNGNISYSLLSKKNNIIAKKRAAAKKMGTARKARTEITKPKKMLKKL